LLGVLHAPVAQRELYVVGDPGAAMEEWNLEACEDRDAHFRLRHARFPKSILRGRLVNEKENLPVVDVLQAALDVCGHAARGAEQAEYIINHVLGWEDEQ
jgi:hypothetical protein